MTLTGTWLGDDNGYWQVYQQGNCVWLTGSPGVYEQITMRGTLHPDFTISVEWEAIGITSPDTRVRGYWGTAILKIDVGDPTKLTIRVVENRHSPISVPGEPLGELLHTTVWSRVADSPIYPPPTPNP